MITKKELNELWGLPVYSVVDKGIFGLRVISGIIVGIQFTHTNPLYCIGFGDNSVWVSKIAKSKEEFLEMFELPNLDNVKSNGANIQMLKD